jgi:hypothetical protein
MVARLFTDSNGFSVRVRKIKQSHWGMRASECEGGVNAVSRVAHGVHFVEDSGRMRGPSRSALWRGAGHSRAVNPIPIISGARTKLDRVNSRRARKVRGVFHSGARDGFERAPNTVTSRGLLTRNRL